MIIGIGTKNKAKVDAVKECLSNHKIFSNVMYLCKDINSGVSDQPKTLEETIIGARNRARKSFEDCSYSIGIEGGLMKLPKIHRIKTQYMNVCACVIYDGKRNYLGLSTAFTYPNQVIKSVFKEGLDVGKAFHKLEITDKTNLGSEEGAIGILTNGRITRKDYAKQAITMALIELEQSDLFEKYK